MTSNASFPNRLLKVDDLVRSDHYYLSEDDVCYYIGEYTARAGFRYSLTNQLISNFKKKPRFRGTPQWWYKTEAIQQVATKFREAVGVPQLRAITFIPVPPSKAKNDPEYDDRLPQMLNAIHPTLQLDVREIVVQDVSTLEVHLGADRPTPDEIRNRYRVDDSLAKPVPRSIAIVDDLLTTGSHFKAMQSILLSYFPATHIVGLFIARRVPSSDDSDDDDLEF